MVLEMALPFSVEYLSYIISLQVSRKQKNELSSKAVLRGLMVDSVRNGPLLGLSYTQKHQVPWFPRLWFGHSC